LEEFPQVFLNECVLEFGAGHSDEFSMVQLMIDRAGVFGKPTELLDCHEMAGSHHDGLIL
jgi:hypothetical protein